MAIYRDPQDVSSGVVLDGYMSIDAAVEYSGYNAQYFRRLMRKGAIEGVKLGQVWLVSIESLDAYLESIRFSDDRRYGPRVYHEYVSEQ
jgi:excisionase family DNA binding protein